jgi:hypothetical protein
LRVWGLIRNRFWPHPDAKEDTVMYLWAHPDGVQDPMDVLFFKTLLGYLSDVNEGKASLNLLQLMLMQYVSHLIANLLPRIQS